MSGSQAHTFASAVQTMTERIRGLGPNPLKSQNGNGTAGTAKEPENDEEAGFRGRRKPPDKSRQTK
jgi:DNA-binding ferritin-like protein